MTSVSGAAATTRHLGKRFAKHWVLDDVNLEVPTSSITALVGPNGAGKSTLLRVLAGLSAPSSGEVSIAGHAPQSKEAQALVAYLDQGRPLYKEFSVKEMLRFGRELDPGWLEERAIAALDDLHIPLERRVRELSGGQRAQVALTLCLSKGAGVLLLDEPVAALDPVAREDAMHLLLGSVVEEGTTVLLSSHIVADLADVSDHVLILREGRLVLADSLEHLLAGHRVGVGPSDDDGAIPPDAVVGSVITGRQRTVLLRGEGISLPSSWELLEPTLEEIVLGYLRGLPSGLLPAGAREGDVVGRGGRR